MMLDYHKKGCLHHDIDCIFEIESFIEVYETVISEEFGGIEWKNMELEYYKYGFKQLFEKVILINKINETVIIKFKHKNNEINDIDLQLLKIKNSIRKCKKRILDFQYKLKELTFDSNNRTNLKNEYLANLELQKKLKESISREKCYLYSFETITLYHKNANSNNEVLDAFGAGLNILRSSKDTNSRRLDSINETIIKLAEKLEKM